MRRHWLWRLDLRNGERTSLWDVGTGALAAGLTAGRGVLGRRRRLARLGGRRALGGGRLAGWDIEDVQGTAGGWLGGGGHSGVVGDVVSVDDVVVPVSLTSLESSTLELEGALPGAGLGGSLILSKGKLSRVVIP